MGPEDIPEDREELYQCLNCEKGNIVKREDLWQCDTCDWQQTPNKIEEVK